MIEVLGQPIDRWCAIGIGSFINRFDQCAAHALSTIFRDSIEILQIAYILTLPVVRVIDIMHQTYHMAFRERYKCVLFGVLRRQQPFKGGVIDIFCHGAVVERQIVLPKLMPIGFIACL